MGNTNAAIVTPKGNSFMVKQIMENIYIIEVPLPDNPLRNLNSYFVKGDCRNLLIDTGFNKLECYEALTAGLEEIGAEMDQTDIFLTHHHTDHSGLCQRIASTNSRIFVSEPDKQILLAIHDRTIIASMGQISRSYGLPDDVLEANQSSNPSIIYRPDGLINYVAVDGRTVFDIGQFQLEVIPTPGHTPGHSCLYDRTQKLLFSGDHIIFDITPNITSWVDARDSLGDYLDSLKTIRSLDILTTLSAHRAPVGDYTKRIDELLAHHERRIRETFDLVKAHPSSNAYEVASHMKWSIRADSWDAFPPAQKWFATGEAASHLEYLYNRQMLSRTVRDGQLIYMY